MGNLQLEYESIRHRIIPGTIALFRGDSALSKTIQWADNAHYNHSALIVGTSGGRHMVLDSNAPGVRPDYLSQRINEYVDYCFLVPTGFDEKIINEAVDKVIDKDLSRDFKYDFMLLPKILVARKLGRKIKHNLESNRSICSVFTGYHYAKFLGENYWVQNAERMNFFTPEDHLRFMTSRWTMVKKF